MPGESLEVLGWGLIVAALVSMTGGWYSLQIRPCFVWPNRCRFFWSIGVGLFLIAAALWLSHLAAHVLNTGGIECRL
jgi:hypothetical protein